MPPRKKAKRKKSSSARVATPPEDLIEDGRRKEILRSFQKAVQSCNDSGEKELPISYVRKPLKQLQLRGLGSEDVQDYFEDESLESIDADMFLRFAADKSLQLDKSNRAFELIDEAQKGVVVFEDLQRVCLDLGEDLTEEELIEMIEYADSTGEGLLSPKHFFRIAHKTNL